MFDISEESLWEFFEGNKPRNKRERISLKGIAGGDVLSDKEMDLRS